MNRITNSDTPVSIISCFFTLMSGFINGSSISVVSEYGMSISESFFSGIYCSGFGGAIFKRGGSVSIVKTCFYNCSAGRIGESNGNSFRIENCIGSFEMSAISRCSYADNGCGDSPSAIFNAQYTEKSINFSYCVSYAGPCSTSLSGPSTVQGSEYINSYMNQGHGILELWRTNYQIKNANLIKCSNLNYYLYINTATLYLINTIFYQNTATTVEKFAGVTGNVQYTDCYTDINTIPVNLVSIPQTINMGYDKNVHCSTYTNTAQIRPRFRIAMVLTQILLF